MRSTELNAFAQSDDLQEVNSERIVEIVRPPLKRLIDALAALPEDASSEARLDCFKSCILALNEVNYEIDTIAREALCERLYEIAGIVGLDSSTDFLDEWRDF